MTAPGWNGPQQQPYGHGHQPPPGWGYPPQPPKKKSKALLIILIAVPAVLLLGGGITAFLIYQDAHKDAGTPPTGAQLSPACDAVSRQTLERLRTTNPDPDLSQDRDGFTSCVWTPTLGKDGEGYRQLTFQVLQPSADTKDRQPECEGRPYQPPKLGDRACMSVRNVGGAIRESQLQFAAAGKFVLVQYEGWDIGLFDTVPTPDEELTKAISDVGTEVAGKLGS